jgi:hypothetical protein
MVPSERRSTTLAQVVLCALVAVLSGATGVGLRGTGLEVRAPFALVQARASREIRNRRSWDPRESTLTSEGARPLVEVATPGTSPLRDGASPSLGPALAHVATSAHPSPFWRSLPAPLRSATPDVARVLSLPMGPIPRGPPLASA